MSFVRIIVALVLAGSPLAAQTRIAGVEVGRAFREYHLTASSMAQFDNERAAILKDSRHQQVEKLTAESKQAEQALIRAAAQDQATRIEAQRVAELKRDELRAMSAALRESLDNRTADLNRRLVAATRSLLETVRQTAAEVGKERGFDAVVDTSGNTNTGLPLVLYARNLTDLTGEVLARLNKDQPAPPAEAPAPAPEGTPPETPAAAQAPPAAAPPATSTPPRKPDVAPPPTGNEFD